MASAYWYLKRFFMSDEFPGIWIYSYGKQLSIWQNNNVCWMTRLFSYFILNRFKNFWHSCIFVYRQYVSYVTGQGNDFTQHGKGALAIRRIFSWPSGWTVDWNSLILFRHSTTVAEHSIYRTLRTERRALITFKMLCPKSSNFVRVKGLVFCILSKVSINSRK